MLCGGLYEIPGRPCVQRDVAIITKTPWLNDRINIVRFRKELEDQVNGSTFDVLSADVAPVHGLSPSFVCYDELAQVPSRALYDALGTALGGRAQPLMLVHLDPGGA